MVAKKSEYQKQFRPSAIKKHQSVYLENLNLRNQRRDREYVHTPLCWGEITDSDEQVGSDSSEEAAAKLNKESESPAKEPEEKYQSLAEIISDSKEKAEILRKKRMCASEEKHKEVPAMAKLSLENKEDVNRVSEDKPVADKTIYDIVDEENRKLNEKLARTYALRGGKVVEDISDESDTDRDMKAADKRRQKVIENDESNLRKKTYVKKRSSRNSSVPAKSKSALKGKSKVKAVSSESSVVPTLPLHYKIRPHRPDRQGPIPKTRPSSSSSTVHSHIRPPFVSYGAGDIEDNLAIHRTHNVRSEKDVYMTALRAKLRREEERRRFKEKQERARSADSLIDRLAVTTPCDMSQWESEYRKQFHGYEPREYERAVSARAVIPRSSAMRGVHRGGCLVIHVD